MASSHFRFSTDILKRLGEELNPNPDQGIIELVKNSYDANALKAKVELQDVLQPGGAIKISDNGDGMSADDLVKGWFVLGRSQKSSNKKTRLNRIPAGNKGLGRLAALRLGRKVKLVTRPRNDKNREYEVNFDWDEIDSYHVVEDAEIQIISRKRAKNQRDGTDITISNLVDGIGRMPIKRLARSMVLLADPFGDDPSSFKPELISQEFDDLGKLVAARYFQDAEFHLVAKLNGQGKASAEIVDFNGKKLWSASHAEISRAKAPRYECPPAKFDMWVFLLDSSKFTFRASTLSEVREWLQNFGGVHVYLNGLRVPPYGNSGDDWVGLNLRRAQSPEVRPSTNTAIGKVTIEDLESSFIQKTDRSGFIENSSFEELLRFVQDSLEWMARERLILAEKQRARERKKTKTAAQKKGESFRGALRKSKVRNKKKLEEDFNAYDRARQKELEHLRKEVDLYRTLSTAGITAATFAHESSGNPLKVIVSALSSLKTRCEQYVGSQYQEKLLAPIRTIEKATGALATLASVTLSLLDNAKRRRTRIDVHEVIRELAETFTPFFEGRDVEVELKFSKGNPYAHGSRAALESIITNLINNSLVALEKNHDRRKIRISTSIENNQCTILVDDNGPGIEGIRTRDMWLPGQTTNPNGTGLGLTIVLDCVRDLDGNVHAIEHGPLGGAEFVVNIPLLSHH